jgi:hypothetical protein
MKRLPPFFYWLTGAALADWLIMRTVTRSAIFMPKTPAMISVYEVLNVVGQFAGTLSSLLVLGALAWIAWRSVQSGAWFAPALVWIALLFFSVLFLFIPPTGWLLVGYDLMLLVAAGIVALRIAGEPTEKRILGALPVLALLIGGIYQIAPAIYDVMAWPGPPRFTNALFSLGELLVVLSPVAWWWIYGRGASWKVWTIAGIPALLFAGMMLGSSSMTGTIAIWSIGLTLYLPWPIYAVSLWLATLTVIVALRHGDPAGCVILLLAAAGYAPQLSTGLLLGPIALWLLTAPESEPTAGAQPVGPYAVPSAGGERKTLETVA